MEVPLTTALTMLFALLAVDVEGNVKPDYNWKSEAAARVLITWTEDSQ